MGVRSSGWDTTPDLQSVGADEGGRHDSPNQGTVRSRFFSGNRKGGGKSPSPYLPSSPPGPVPGRVPHHTRTVRPSVVVPLPLDPTSLGSRPHRRPKDPQWVTQGFNFGPTIVKSVTSTPSRVCQLRYCVRRDRRRNP